MKKLICAVIVLAVSTAHADFGVCGTGVNCCVAHLTPGCGQAGCCQIVCAIDLFCCDVQWDQGCVDAAVDLCTICSVSGACCFTDGSCREVIAPECGDLGGDYQGDGTSCDNGNCIGGGVCGDPSAGNCCDPNGTPNCNDATCCELVCELDPICCVINWDSLCASLAVDFCGFCNACCLPDGSCLYVTKPAECSGLGGVFGGFLTSCDDSATCTGACFFVGGCVDVTSLECGDLGGDFQGIGTTCIGACCLTDGRCLEVSLLACGEFGGDFHGTGTSCDIGICIGACCLTDASCLEVSPLACGDLGGEFQGTGTNCDIGICIGACCLTDASCCEVSPLECGDLGGEFQGTGTTCVATNCGAAVNCPWDCGDGNGNVGINDLLALLAQWGDVGLSCDFDLGPPGAGIEDFLELLANWGPCP